DTVKKARAYLTEQGHDPSFHDFKTAGVPAERLPAWVAAVGWEKLLNRQGTTWRKLAPELQASVVDAASAMALMQAQPSVIKRPVVEWPSGQVSVGFAPALFALHLGR
ncbi:MAG: ArsC/Spx/MgsR family protein, partial [Ideonella sp.]|nr:ArsC/Spx/MgsR family protein [Ideonella sp.]